MGKITYVINDGSSETIQDNVQEYFIDSQNVELQPPEKKSGYEFDGCYFDKSCEDKYNVGKLGKDNYLGDVTLYGRWNNLPPANVKDFNVTDDDYLADGTKKPETITVKKTDSINNSTSVTFTTSAKVKFTFTTYDNEGVPCKYQRYCCNYKWLEMLKK